MSGPLTGSTYPIETVIQQWLTAYSSQQPEQAAPVSEREQAIAALRAAGLVAEPSEAMRLRASQATMSLAEVQAALDRTGGKPLSEVILEGRGAKG